MSKLKLTTRGTLVSLGLAALAVVGIAFAPSSPGLVEHTHTPAAVVKTLHEPVKPSVEPTTASRDNYTVTSAPAPTAAPTATSTPDWTYAPCDWFTTGHVIPAYTHTDACYNVTTNSIVSR